MIYITYNFVLLAMTFAYLCHRLSFPYLRSGPQIVHHSDRLEAGTTVESSIIFLFSDIAEADAHEKRFVRPAYREKCAAKHEWRQS